MKKIKYLTLALSVGTLVVPAGIFAAETKTVPVTQSVDSTYEVTLPKSINMGTSTTKDFAFTVSGNIEPSAVVSVTADSAVNLVRENDSSTIVEATVVLDQSSFDEQNVDGGVIENGSGTITANPTKAGNYSGVVNFYIDYTIKPNHN